MNVGLVHQVRNVAQTLEDGIRKRARIIQGAAEQARAVGLGLVSAASLLTGERREAIFGSAALSSCPQADSDTANECGHSHTHGDHDYKGHHGFGLTTINVGSNS